MNIINKKPYRLKEFPNYMFCYDRDNGTVLLVADLDEETKKENEEWKNKFGKKLYDTVTIGNKKYMKLKSVGLMHENWKNKESRDEYLFEWSLKIMEESTILAKELIGNQTTMRLFLQRMQIAIEETEVGMQEYLDKQEIAEQ